MSPDARRPQGGNPPADSELPAPLALLHRAAARFPTHSALAARLQVTPSHVSRLLKGTAGLSPYLCLRLADLLGQDRAFVLRACGHARLSDRLFPGGAPTATEGQRVQDAIEQLPPFDRRLIQALVERLIHGEPIELTSLAPVSALGGQKGGAR